LSEQDKWIDPKELLRLERRLARAERALWGDPDEDREGLIESQNRHQIEINKFNALLMPDIHGNGGVVNDLNEVRYDRSRREKREGYFWHFVTAAFVQFLILIGLIVVNWDNIMGYIVLHQHMYQAQSVERETKKLKAQRAKRKKHKVVEVPKVIEVPEVSDEASQDVQK
jgi:hypothetical protein